MSEWAWSLSGWCRIPLWVFLLGATRRILERAEGCDSLIRLEDDFCVSWEEP